MFGFLKKKRNKAAPAAAEPAVEQLPVALEAEQAAEPAEPAEPDAPVAVAGQAPVEQLIGENREAGPQEAEVDLAAAPPAAPAPEVPLPAAAEAVAKIEAQPEAMPEGAAEHAEHAAQASEVVEEAAVVEPAPAPAKLSWAARLKAGLARTRQQFGGGLASLFGRRKIDEDLLEELETTLLMADCGVEATQHLIDDLRRRWKRDRLETADQLQQALADGLHEIIAPLEAPLQIGEHQPFVIMLAGINGSGKTTSIGKLAKHYQAQGKSVLLAAGDTFRAAAREQLQRWGERNNVSVVAQDGGDSAAVIFDAINAAKARKIDIVLADTAGRLPTQLHLMEEIAKVRRVISKAEASAPHEVLLVLDANIGQNALTQVQAFDKAIGVTGLVVTKLDGTAKGGVLAAIARQCPKPLRFIGVGEGIDDLQPFRAREFVDALFEPVAGSKSNKTDKSHA